MYGRKQGGQGEKRGEGGGGVCFKCSRLSDLVIVVGVVMGGVGYIPCGNSGLGKLRPTYTVFEKSGLVIFFPFLKICYHVSELCIELVTYRALYETLSIAYANLSLEQICFMFLVRQRGRRRGDSYKVYSTVSLISEAYSICTATGDLYLSIPQ